MSTLQRYIFRRITVLTLASFAAVLAVMWTTEVMGKLHFLSSGQSLLTFLHMVALLTPQISSPIIPIALVIGTVQVFTAMNADSEMAAISASGMSRAAIAVPVMAVAGITSVYILVSNHFIEPAANRAFRDLLVQSRADLLTSQIRDGVFTRLGNDLTIYVDRRLPGNTLEGIMVSDTREENTALVYYAQSGAIGTVDGNDVIVMTNGQIQRKDVKSGSLSVIRFNSYAISLAQFAAAAAKFNYWPYERDTIDLIHPDPNDRMVKTQPGYVRGELHRRFTDWLYPILYGLIGLVFAGQTQSHRMTRFNVFALAITVAMAFRGGSYMAFSANRATNDVIWFFYALPIGGIIVTALMYRFGVTVRTPDRVTHAVHNAVSHLGRVRARAARARAT